MDKQKLNLILDKLLEKTKQESLEWEKTADKNTFLVVLANDAVSISKIADSYYSLDFRNESGDVVESVTIAENDFPIEAFSENADNTYIKARQIFDLAHKQSKKSEQTVDRILEQLTA